MNMARKKRNNSAARPAMLIATLLVMLSPSLACPESCFCFDSFVTCSDFQYLDLTLLPPGTDTLVLSRGEVEEFPPGFLAMATDLKMLEIISVSARVVRGSAFRGLGNLDLFSITGSTFDIVEPDGFSGLTEVSKFLISDTKFGRVGKHAFGYISSILEFRIWSSAFEAIADEAFYKLTDILSFQLYQCNITFIGTDVFKGASEIDDVTIYMNRIQSVAEGSFENIAATTSRMVLYANKFHCSCDIAWMLTKATLSEYLSTNECTYYDHARPAESTFRLSDITKDALCPTVPSTDVVESTPSGDIKPSGGVEESANVTEKILSTERSTQSPQLMSSTDMTTKNVSHQSSTLASSSSSASSSSRPSSSSPSSQTLSVTSSSSAPVLSSKSSSESSSHISSSTVSLSSSSSSSSVAVSSSSSSKPVDSSSPPSETRLTTAGPAASKPTLGVTKEPLTSEIYVSEASPSLDPSRKVTRVAPVKEGLVDNEQGGEHGHARPYSTSAIGMTTAGPDNSSYMTRVNLLFLLVLSGVSLVLISTPFS